MKRGRAIGRWETERRLRNYARKRTIANMPCGTPRREGDEMVCSRCGLRWDTGTDRPNCAKEADL